MIVALLSSVPVLLGGAVLSLLLRDNRSRAVAALATQAVACVLVLASVVPILRGGPPLVVSWSWPAPIDEIAFRVDGLSAFFLVWSVPMTLLGTIYATGYLAPFFEKGRNGGPHFALLNLTSLAFVLVYSVQNALVFLLGWEIAAVAAWLLVIWDYGNQKIRFAGFNYLVSTHVGLFVLVAAFMLLHGKTASMDFAAFGTYLAKPSPQRGTIFLLLGIAFALKSAFFPFHTWLPRAHSAAPAHVSALMSGVIHKAGLFGFLRFTLLLERPEEWMGWCVLGFGAASAFFGVLSTTTQRDLKRLLGYSSTENVGIAALGFGVGYLGQVWGRPVLVVLGYGGGLLHVLNHAVFKCLLFYAAGAIYRATHTVDIERLGGLGKRMPRTAVFFLVGSLATAALPPLNGFVGEFLIYSGLFSGQAPSGQEGIALLACAAVLAFVGAVSALAVSRAFGLTFLGTPRDPGIHPSADCATPLRVPMLVHAILAVVLGLVPELGLFAIDAALREFPVGAEAGAAWTALAPVVWASRAFAVVALLFGTLAWLRGRNARRGPVWGCGYQAATPRMQYTASAFSEHFARIFASFFSVQRKEKLPHGVFPEHPSQLATHHVDAVERRIFEVLGRGDVMITQTSERIPEQPRFAFAAGLITLVVLGAVLAGVLAR